MNKLGGGRKAASGNPPLESVGLGNLADPSGRFIHFQRLTLFHHTKPSNSLANLQTLPGHSRRFAIQGHSPVGA